jgi:hypothetical protein
MKKDAVESTENIEVQAPIIETTTEGTIAPIDATVEEFTYPTGEPEDVAYPSDDEPTQPDELVSTEPGKELTELEKLINKRTGFWQIRMELQDLKWVKHACQGKFQFTGPNEAFMLMNCFLGFSGAVTRKETSRNANEPVALQAAAIEACALLLNKYTGSGTEAAERTFRIAISLNDIVMEMRNLDNIIAQLREQEAKEKEGIARETMINELSGVGEHNPDVLYPAMSAPVE